jgi:integrase
MTGHVRRRGKTSWEIKFDVGQDPLTGKRRIRYSSFKGTKRGAEIEAARLVARAADGALVDPSKLTVGQFFDRWETNWVATNVSPKTRERYAELISHVRRVLGGVVLQKVRPAMLQDLYGELQRTGKQSKKKGGQATGLSARTVGHVHRVLHRALGHAAQWGHVAQNAAALVDPPRVPEKEIEILPAADLGLMLNKLRGTAIYPIAAIALGTGVRRGELLALRWQDIDFDKGLVRVERSLESSKDGLRFKAPKTRHGRRTITLPASIVAELRGLWKAQQEQRLALGLGKAGSDALVFSKVDSGPLDPDGVSKAWKRAATVAGKPGLTFHALRHTHASQLIAAGVDILTVSRRLGHGSPTITLSVYGHLFTNADDRSATVLESTFAAARTE